MIDYNKIEFAKVLNSRQEEKRIAVFSQSSTTKNFHNEVLEDIFVETEVCENSK